MDIEEPVVIRKKWHSAPMRFRLRRRVARVVADPSRYEAAYGRFRGALRGTLPTTGGSGVVVAACNDYYYWNFAITMLRSIERHPIVEHVHLHLCEPRPETERHLASFAATLRNVRLTWTADDGSLAKTLVYPTIYYAAVRFLIAPLVMEATDAPVLCIDIDGIAVRPIWPAYEPARDKGDVVLIKRGNQKDHGRRILASALGINPTASGRRFAVGLARSIAAAIELRPLYHVDQIVIHYLTDRLETKGGLKVVQMPKALADFDFNEDAVIWTAKGWQRKRSDVYMDAMKAVDRAFPDVPSAAGTIEIRDPA